MAAVTAHERTLIYGGYRATYRCSSVLFAAVVAVPIAQRLGIGAVLGYLIAGIAIGPWG